MEKISIPKNGMEKIAMVKFSMEKSGMEKFRMEIFTIPKSGFSKLWKFQKMVFRRRFVGERERTSTNRALVSKTVCHFLLLKISLGSLLCAIPKFKRFGWQSFGLSARGQHFRCKRVYSFFHWEKMENC